MFWPVYHVTCWRVPPKGEFLDIYVTTFFGVPKFKNTSAVRVILFFKMFKIESIFRKCLEKLENSFRFWDNLIWKCFNKLPLLGREYLSFAVNGLKKSQKICTSLREIWCYLSKCHLKWVFLDIHIEMFVAVPQLKNISAMRVIFLLKMLKIGSKFRKCERKMIFF